MFYNIIKVYLSPSNKHVVLNYKQITVGMTAV